LRFILINTPLFREKNDLHPEDYLPPIGLGYIATYLKHNNIEVELIDAVYERISLTELISYLNNQNPEFVAVNIFTTNYDLVKELIESIDIRTYIIIGGLATNKLYTKIVKWRTENPIDIIIGDGEHITLDIIKRHVKEKAVFSSKNRRVFKVTGDSMYFIKNISDVPFDRSFLKNEPVKNHFGLLEANIITGRGCIYNCTFCAAARSQNKDYPVRERTEASVINELNLLKKTYQGINTVRILDDLFLKNRNSIKRAIRIFSKICIQWRSMAHIRVFNNVTQSEINALRKSGCSELFIGMETGSPRILKSINKTSDKAEIIRNVSKIYKAGINVKGYFIYGFPDETENDMQMTYDLACLLKKLSIKYGINFRTSVFQFRPYHGTEIFRTLKKKNIDIEKGQTVPNQALSDIIGRNQFNFHRGNYSEVCLDTIHDYICKTNDLNETRNSSNQYLVFNRYKQQKTV
jgi:anaerobic magnesium-protoporphyrin IX monomethyl ester cyclase